MLQSESVAQGGVDINYWRLFRDLPDAYLLHETYPPYRIVEMNSALERATGVQRRMAIGQPLLKIFPHITVTGHQTAPIKHTEAVIRTGRPKRLHAYRYDIRDASGAAHIKYWDIYLQPVFNDAHRVQYVLLATRDVTSQVRAERRAVTVEGRLQAALTIGKVGSWLLDVEKNTLTSDRNIAKLFRLTKNERVEGILTDLFSRLMYPGDVPRVRAALKRSIQERIPFDEEFRVVTADGEQRWVLARGKVEEDEGKMYVSGVLVDITERHDLQAQVELARRQDQLNRRAAKILQKRNEELEAISHTKDEFVALASHQLRTPATAVKQYLGMVLQGYAGDITAVQADMLSKAFESNERQIQIINQILNAARADTGRLIMVPIPLDVRNLVRGVWNDMHASFEQRNQQAELILPRTPILVMADQGYVRMAVENILYNACIYTPDGGIVQAKLERVGDMARLSITDTGVGIKRSDFSKLFAKFSRIHNPLSVQAGGSGIGLYLASEIIRLHGGKIDVESKINRGTTFAISLPLMHNKNPRSTNAR